MTLDFDKLAADGWLNLLTELARAYKRITGRHLGITHELGELHACAALGLDRSVEGNEGHDAVDRDGLRVQIKTRAPRKDDVVNRKGTTPAFESLEFDYAVLVLLKGDYSLESMWRAGVADVKIRFRQGRRDMGVSTFIRIAKQVE